MRNWLGCAFILSFAILAQAQKPLLLRKPTASASQLVFSYGDDLWSAPRDGGLEKAVDLVLDQLKKSPRNVVDHQPFPNYHPTKGTATGGGR